MSAYKYINPTMNWLLSSPWHRLLSRRIMTVSYTGKKTGKAYKTPVSYYRDDDSVYCFTNGKWRYNFTTETDAKLRLNGRNYMAKGKIFAGDKVQQTNIMCQYFKAVPQDKKFYGIQCDAHGEPIRSQVAHATTVVDIIQFKLSA